MVNSFSSLFNYMQVDHASASMMNRRQAIYFSWLGPDFRLSVAWSYGDQLMVFFRLGTSVALVGISGISRCHNMLHHLSSVSCLLPVMTH